MKKTAFYCDLVFFFSVFSLFFLCFFRYLRLPVFAALLLGLISGAGCTVPIYFYLKKKEGAILQKRSDEREQKLLFSYLALLKNRELIKTFSPFLKGYEKKSAEKTPCFEKDGERVFLRFSFEPLSADDAAEFIKLRAEKKENSLYCTDLAPQAEELLLRYGFAVHKGAEVYFLFKEQGKMPDFSALEKQKENKWVIRKRVWFSKKNSRPFLTGGVLLLFCSLLSPFPFYYLLVGSALLLLSLCVRFFGIA